MNKLIDTACPGCGHVAVDVWVTSLESARFPQCYECGVQVERAWISAPSVTPQGTRPERNMATPARSAAVNTKAIAEETTFEVEQKWLRYSDPKIAEQHVSREINEKAGIADAQGNEKPIPKPAPIVLQREN